MTDQKLKTMTHPTKGSVEYDPDSWEAPGGSSVQINRTHRSEPDGSTENFYLFRNGEDPDGTILLFDQGEWDAFVAGARDGEFDPETFSASAEIAQQNQE